MILIAIGSNLTMKSVLSPLELCEQAAADLALLDGLSLVAASRWYRSAPIPRSDQDDYVNGVARFEGQIEPRMLMDHLHRIEQLGGRERSVANAARTLDLDLIDCNGLVSAGPYPVLPHPRAHERAFVLAPLIDVAPGWIHPALGETAEALLARLLPQDITRIALPLRNRKRSPK